MKLTYSLLQTSFECNELTFKQYKNFLKSFYGDTVDVNVFFKNFIELFVEISNKPIDFFYDLSLVDMFVLLVQLRIYTLGPTCQIIIKTEEGEQTKKNTITLNLERIKQDVLEFLDLNTPSYIVDENINLLIDFPSVNNLTENDSIESYIKECIVGDKHLNKITKEQCSILYSKLSAKVAAQLFESKQNLVQNFKALNHLSPYEGFAEYVLNFDLSLNNFLWYCKLFFNETLETLFDNIFYLTHLGNFDLQYLEHDCTPGEYVYFLKKLNFALSQKQNKTEESDVVSESM